MSDYEEEYEYGDDGDSEIEYPSDDDGGEGDGGAAEEDDPSIQIENNYYEGEDVLRRGDADKAITLFQSVVEEESKLSPDSNKYRFQALKEIVVLAVKLNRKELASESFTQLMSLLPLVTSNDGTSAMDRILDEVSTADDVDLQSAMYEKALVHLKATNERLWFSTQLKLARSHVAHRDATKLQEAVDALHDSCRTPAGEDDKAKATYLMDVYALRIQLCGITKKFDAIRKYYDAVNKLQKVAIADPRVMGTIRETFGEMHMTQKNWKQAFDEFFESFKNYQAAGNTRAVRCLKCVLLANMIAGIEVNPFDSQEAKAYENDPQITAMVQLRRAFDKNDINGFQRVLADPKAHIQDDPFMLEYLAPLMRNFRGQVVLQIVRPYKVVRLEFLAKELDVEGTEAEQLVAQLILDGRLVGHIDQTHGVLHLSAKSAQESGTFDALKQAAVALRRISARIHERAAEGRSY